MKKLTRLEFFRLFIPFFVILGFGKLAAACGGNSGDTDEGDGGGDNEPQPDCLNAGTQVAIAGNHGHVLVVSKADVAAGTTKAYDIQGSSAHSHTVTLTVTHFASLAANQQVVVTSTGGPHPHNVTVSCALA